MAVTTIIPGSLSESVKEAVRSSSTCSASTVSSLQLLLRCGSKLTSDNGHSNSKVTKASKSTKLSTTVTRTKSSRSVNPKIAARVAVFQNATEVPDGTHLSQHEKLVLATEVFNATSKTLSGALQRNAASKSPLQPTSPNRTMKSPAKAKVSKDPPLTTARLESGVISVAECARIALSSLRSMRSEQTCENDTYPNLQLEQGACILAGRFIALGLHDLAYKELRSLKKRLQQYMENRASGRQKTANKTMGDIHEEEVQKETTADLLSFTHLEHAKSLFTVLVQYQANAVRLIASEKKPYTVQKVCSILALSNPSSPAKIIMDAFKAESLSSDKAALQLLSLSNNVSSLSSITQRACNASSSAMKAQIRPVITLVLQLLSLEIRSMSWEVSGHVCESKREFWVPLARFLENFAHSGPKIDRGEFAAVYKTVHRLQAAMDKNNYEKSSVDARAGATWKIAYALGELAQESSCLEEALKLYEGAKTPVGDDQPLLFSMIRCRIASVHLICLKSSAPRPLAAVAQSLLEATTALKSSNKGSSSDLEELLAESAKLKKLAMAYLGESLATDRVKLDDGSEIHTRIVEYLHTFIRFLRRYVGRQPLDDNDSNGLHQFQQVLHQSKNIILTAVDSVVAVGKMSVMRQTPAWDDMLPIFADCKRLLNVLENLAGGDCDLDESWGTSFVKLSNIFWSRYLKEKEAGKGYSELLPLLEQSTSLLKDCPATDRTAGFAALKFERLAHLYTEANMRTKSIIALQRSIQEHIDAETLQQFMEHLTGRPPHSLFHAASSPGFILNRVLSYYLKMKIRRRGNKEQTIFDDKSLSSNERGILLEWQMGLLVESQSHDADSEAFRSMFQLLISELLSLYSMNDHPVRRLRVILSVLRFTLEYPNIIDPVVTESLVKDANSSLSSDIDLAQDTDLDGFITHIKNSLLLVLAFRHGDIHPDQLRRLVSSWVSIVQKCDNWESLGLLVDEPAHWIAQMKAACDYMEARGLWKLNLSTSELLLRVMELQSVKDCSSIVLSLSRCALQYCRLGDCKRCLPLLDRAGHYASTQSISYLALMSYNLAYAEYLLETGELTKAEKTLSAARNIYQSKTREKSIDGNSGRSKLAWERVVIDATFLYSRIAHSQGFSRNALFFAKLSVRLSSRLWAKLDRLSGKKNDPELGTKEQTDIDLVVDGIANMDISSTSVASAWNYSEGAIFWTHIGSHHACLLNLMRLSAHNGLFQDAIYYGQQALKVNQSLGASVRSIACQAELGSEWIRSDHISEAKEVLDAAFDVSQDLDNSIETITLKTSLAALNKAQGQHDDVIRLLRDAEDALAEISQVKLDHSLNITPPEVRLEEKMAEMSIRKPSTRKKTESNSTRCPRRAKASSKSTLKVDPDSNCCVDDTAQSGSILLLRTEILRQQATVLLATQNLDEAVRLLSMARQFSLSTSSQISLQIEETEHMLADAMRSIATHAVYCVLSESTLSIPSIQTPAMPNSVLEAVKSPATKAPSSKKQKAVARELRSRTTRTMKKEVDIASIMLKARASIDETITNAITFSSTIEGYAISRLMGRISMLLHATTPGHIDQESLSPANANELGRITAFEREHLAIGIDKQLAGCSDPLRWPTPPIASFETKTDFISNFTQQYVDILPVNWNVVSISLNADRTEFVISRMHRDSTPFLLRLPLKRGNEDGDEEDEFTFDAGKQEMKEIIRLANASAHDARSRVDRKSKKEWWATRESLDQRLATLLCNMENVWLGGFRGIFSAAPRDVEQLSRFAGLFESVLNKHLPSRCKASNRKGGKIKLHQNVLEIFVGLRDIDSHENPEDVLMDLLYFVVDILQFQGERNAYDEIDFDMMVVDTLDALRNCHEAVQSKSHPKPPNHTILILDKALHAFPWESLPCLQGLPVSRMPSLECLRSRILRFGSTEASSSSFHIDRNNGSYVLNPSGDLRATQSTFEEQLSKIGGWSGIINRNPTEDELKTALENKSLFLYFGHGSGAQYIRGRTIKRLDQCAVTFLMGCSSGVLAEAGELEPYGTPMNYMHAGTPALVATLWDVTDKDIDRFAKCTFEKWGLLQADESLGTPEPTPRAVQSRSTKRNEAATRSISPSVLNSDDVALDEAVAKSRDSCLLKYLNGAAPVIYGIPMYLGA